MDRSLRPISYNHGAPRRKELARADSPPRRNDVACIAQYWRNFYTLTQGPEYVRNIQYSQFPPSPRGRPRGPRTPGYSSTLVREGWGREGEDSICATYLGSTRLMSVLAQGSPLHVVDVRRQCPLKVSAFD